MAGYTRIIALILAGANLIIHINQLFNQNANSIAAASRLIGVTSNYIDNNATVVINNWHDPSLHSTAGKRTLLQQEPPPLVILDAATAQAAGAVCLDGTPPGYSLDPGSGSGQNSWIVHLEGGGWCGSTSDCLQRSGTNLGSSKFMTSQGFGGLLSNSPSLNPDLYNWNRVHVRYCDGGSFKGNSEAQVTGSDGQTTTLYFHGQQIWDTIIDTLMSKGLGNAERAILSGDSAGGLAALLNCNRFRQKLAPNTDVKCLADGSFFMDIPNIDGSYSFRQYYQDVVDLHKINLPAECTSLMSSGQCLFPENLLGSLNVPFFFVQSAYDYFQVQYILAPPGSYSDGSWDGCRQSLGSCSSSEISTITDQLRGNMLAALKPLLGSEQWGMHVVSCYYHTEAIDDNIWNGITKVNDMNVAQAFHSWYFDGKVVQVIDCAFPCNPTCTSP